MRLAASVARSSGRVALRASHTASIPAINRIVQNPSPSQLPMIPTATSAQSKSPSHARVSDSSPIADRSWLTVPLVEYIHTQATAAAAPVDPAYQARCIEDYQCTQAARGFSTLTIDNGTATLERFLAACGRPAWEVTCEDIDRVVGGLAAVGMATSTRRGPGPRPP